MKQLATQVLATLVMATLATPVLAEVTTVSGGGAFLSFPGYGYEYVASWESSSGSFQFVPTIGSVFNTSGSFAGSAIYAFGLFSHIGTPVAQTTYDFSATVQIRFIDRATGTLALPPSLRTSARHQTTTNPGVTVSQVHVAPAEIRFSNHVYTVAQSVADGGGVNIPNGSGSPTSGGPASLRDTEIRYSVAQHFVGGHVVTASPDPFCASIECMIPGRDTLTPGGNGFRYYLHTGSVVPEPGTVALFLCGMLGIAFARQRQPVNAGSAG